MGQRLGCLWVWGWVGFCFLCIFGVWIEAVWIGLRNELREMKWWEGGSKKWGWSAREMSGIGLRNERIELRNGEGKLTVHGEDRLCEGEDLERLSWGRWWSSVWLSLESTCCFECMWESSDGNCLKWKWEQKFFYALGPLFYGQHWKYFQFDTIFRSNQTAYFTKKRFWN